MITSWTITDPELALTVVACMEDDEIIKCLDAMLAMYLAGDIPKTYTVGFYNI